MVYNFLLSNIQAMSIEPNSFILVMAVDVSVTPTSVTN